MIINKLMLLLIRVLVPYDDDGSDNDNKYYSTNISNHNRFRNYNHKTTNDNNAQNHNTNDNYKDDNDNNSSN